MPTRKTILALATLGNQRLAVAVVAALGAAAFVPTTGFAWPSRVVIRHVAQPAGIQFNGRQAGRFGGTAIRRTSHGGHYRLFDGPPDGGAPPPPPPPPPGDGGLPPGGAPGGANRHM